jgi:hypothetical protein
MDRCARDGHRMVAWPDGVHLMATFADAPFSIEGITQPTHCSTCASLTFVLRGAERVFVPHYEADLYGKPIRRPFHEPAP